MGNVRPGAGTELKAGFRIFFAFKLELSDEVVDKDIFKKFKFEDMVEDAKTRVKTDHMLSDKLVMLAKMLGKNSRITTISPIFDTFTFPDYCFGATLGPGRNGLDLRRKFQIPVVALVRKDGTVVWWPGPDDVVHPGDQGLLMKDYQGYTVGQTPIVTEHMNVVSCLQHEPSFREKFDLDDGDTYPWQTDEAAAQKDEREKLAQEDQQDVAGRQAWIRQKADWVQCSQEKNDLRSRGRGPQFDVTGVATPSTRPKRTTTHLTNCLIAGLIICFLVLIALITRLLNLFMR